MTREGLSRNESGGKMKGRKTMEGTRVEGGREIREKTRGKGWMSDGMIAAGSASRVRLYRRRIQI